MTGLLSWSEYVDRFAVAARRSRQLARVRDRFVSKARRILTLPLVRRVYRYEDIGHHRTWLDGRAIPLREPMKTIFALAMSDHGANQLLVAELPMLAAAARLSGDRRLVRRVHEQLHEMAAWSPLQRPGWCAFGDHLPPDGKDGNWLATGTGIRAIGDTIEVLGREALPPATVARLDQLLAAEIVSIVDDWRARRPWFVAHRMPLTNQWVLPTEGLVRACLLLGRERHAASYRLGTANLMAALNVHGPQGAFEEGIHYADFTVGSLVSAARAMARDNDRRAMAHPFLRRFPVWALHHFQPGGFFINPFDAFSAARGSPAMLKQTLAMAAVCLESTEALWALDHLAGGPDDSLAGLVSHILPRPRRPRVPCPYGAYRRATRVNWRSSWAPDATGVWVRGGHATDCHDHRDRGHVNFILRGKPVFIEAGTPAYHNPRLNTDYASGRGHNVLQLGTAQPPASLPAHATAARPGWQIAGASAPITVRRLNAQGGDITVAGTAAYPGLRAWLRRVRWDADHLVTDDSVCLPRNRQQVVCFRWHLGTRATPRITRSGRTFTVEWDSVRLTLSADCAVRIQVEPMPDHTLEYRPWDDRRPEHLHTCLLVRTAQRVAGCRITVEAAGA